MDTTIAKFTELNDLSSEDLGGKILFSTDDWFAAAENLLKSEPPVWKEGFTDFGKWMDGWETRRKRQPGHDWCLIRLGVSGRIVGVEIDTAFFTGNFSPRFSLQAALLSDDFESKLPQRDPSMGKGATLGEIEQAGTLNTELWETLIPMTPLGSGYPETRHNFFEVRNDSKFSHLRLNMFPDGGIARIRTYGMVSTPEDPEKLVRYQRSDFESEPHYPSGGLQQFDGPLVDLLAMENGSVCMGYSDAHYGHPRNLARKGTGKNMGDGWETARRLDRPAILKTLEANPNILEFIGSEWAIFKLGVPGIIQVVVVDTNHFKGNFPDSIAIEGAEIESNSDDDEKSKLKSEDVWTAKIVGPQKLGPHRRHFFGPEIETHGRVTHVRVTIKPDGGISRIKLLGKI